MKAKPSNDSYDEQQTMRRREEALKKMLATPHKPHQPTGKKRPSPAKRPSRTKKKG